MTALFVFADPISPPVALVLFQIEYQKESKNLDPKLPLSVSMKELYQYFMTDAISRASQTMARCVKAFKTHVPPDNKNFKE